MWQNSSRAPACLKNLPRTNPSRKECIWKMRWHTQIALLNNNTWIGIVLFNCFQVIKVNKSQLIYFVTRIIEKDLEHLERYSCTDVFVKKYTPCKTKRFGFWHNNNYRNPETQWSAFYWCRGCTLSFKYNRTAKCILVCFFNNANTYCLIWETTYCHPKPFCRQNAIFYSKVSLVSAVICKYQ